MLNRVHNLRLRRSRLSDSYYQNVDCVRDTVALAAHTLGDCRGDGTCGISPLRASYQRLSMVNRAGRASGEIPPRKPPTTSSSSVLAATVWRPRTIWQRFTASRMSQYSRREGSEAVTRAGTPRSCVRTIFTMRAPESTSTRL